MPLYPATEGITAAQLRQLVWEHYDRFTDVVEPLPAALRAAERLPDRAAALAGVHFPDDEDEAAAGRERLALEELLLLQLAVAGRRRAPPRDAAGGGRWRPTGELVDPWTKALPFELTGDQRAGARADRPRPGRRAARCSGC